MSEFSSLSVGPLPSPEPPTPGIVVVTPLSAENCEKADALKQHIETILGGKLRGKLKTPHKDITHGHILDMGTGILVPDFNEVIRLSRLALIKSARPGHTIVATFDSIDTSEKALFAQATEGVEPIADLRRRFLADLILGLESITGVTPRLKSPNFVHTTLGRPSLLDENIPVEDTRRAIEEALATGNHPPMVQRIGSLDIMEETEKYVLTRRETVELG